jgi:hypothetical protein
MGLCAQSSSEHVSDLFHASTGICVPRDATSPGDVGTRFWLSPSYPLSLERRCPRTCCAKATKCSGALTLRSIIPTCIATAYVNRHNASVIEVAKSAGCSLHSQSFVGHRCWHAMRSCNAGQRRDARHLTKHNPDHLTTARAPGRAERRSRLDGPPGDSVQVRCA